MKKSLSLFVTSFLFFASVFAAPKKAPTFDPIDLDVPVKTSEFFTTTMDPRTDVIGIIGRLGGIYGFTESYNGEDSYSANYDTMFKKYKEHKAVITMQALSKKKIEIMDFINLAYHIKPDFSGLVVELDPYPESLREHWQKIKPREIYTFIEQVYDFVKTSNYQRIYMLKRGSYIADIGTITNDIEKMNMDKWSNAFFGPAVADKIVVNSSPINAGFSFYDKVPGVNGESISYITIFPDSYYSTLLELYSFAYIYEFCGSIYDDVKDNFSELIKTRQKLVLNEDDFKKWEKNYEFNNYFLTNNIVNYFFMEFIRSAEYQSYAEKEDYPFLYDDWYSYLEKQASNQYFYDTVALIEKYRDNRDKYPTIFDFKDEAITFLNSIKIEQERFMKKLLLSSTLLCLFFTSCVSTKLQEGEELVKYKKIDYKIENKNTLTEKELREDCDWLKYIFYNTYGGAEEAIALGFDLDQCIEDIFTQTKAKTTNGTGIYSTNDFKQVTRKLFSERLTNTDQHIGIGGSLHDSVCIYHSKIFLEKQGDKYVVKKSEEDKVKPGDVYTGPESNLYKYYTEDGELYRYSLMTKKRVKSGVISVNGENVAISVEAEKQFGGKDSWTGVKYSDKTLYMSLGGCVLAYGVNDSNQKFSLVWDKFIADISANAKGKENIIMDMRGNGGGYLQYPADMLAAAYYFDHTDKQYQRDLSSQFMNEAFYEVSSLVSPVTMQFLKDYYTKDCTQEFARLAPEVQEYYKEYWKHIKTRPIRTLYPRQDYQTPWDELPGPDFQGTVYILINSNSASAAEFGTEMAYCLKDRGINVVLVGENSWGGVKYGGMSGLCLPHSGLYLYLGTSYGESPLLQSLPTWKGEGMGFFPDYWATNDLILQTLIQLTGDTQLNEVLKGLDKGLL